jgi:hypothetical protein
MPRPDAASSSDAPPSPFTPRSPVLVALAAFCVWVLILFLPMFTGDFLGGPNSDQTFAGIPFRAFWAAEFHRTGHIPLWNPYLFGGLPFVGAMHGDIFYPTSFLRILFSADHVLTIVFALHLVLAGLFTYVFLRTIGVGWTASVVGGLAYQLSGIVASLVQPGHDGKMIVSALLPLMLTALVIAIRRRRLEGYGLLALVVGLDILSPQTQMTQYSLIFAGLLALWLCLYDEQRPERVSRRWMSLALAALAVAVGFGLSMIQILPFIKYNPYGARTIGAQGWTYATMYSMPPVDIVEWLVATFTGVLRKYWGENPLKFHSEYVGAAVLALAALGVGSRPRRPFAWFLGGCFALFLLVSLGAHTPFYRLWYAVVPGAKVTRAEGMAFFIPTFIVACFVAFGVERLERGEGARVLRGVLVGAGVLLLLGISGALGSLAVSLAGPRAALATADANSIALGAFISALAAAAVAGVGLLALRGRLKGWSLATALFLVVGAELFINARRYFTWSPPASRIYADDAVTSQLKATPLPYRVLDLPPGGGVYPEAFLMEKGIPDALGYHGNELNAYDQLLGGKNVWANLTSNGASLLDLLAVRYLILPMPAHAPDYHVVGHADQTVQGGDAFLLEANRTPPYARLVGAAAKVPENQIVPTLMDPRLDHDRVVLLPPDAPVQPAHLDSLPPALPGRATVTAWEPGAMTIKLDPPPDSAAYLVVSENWYPDWHASVDGRPALVLRGQETLLTVPVPAGAREVRLWFASSAYATGKKITFASLGVIVLWLWVPVWRRRRSG